MTDLNVLKRQNMKAWLDQGGVFLLGCQLKDLGVDEPGRIQLAAIVGIEQYHKMRHGKELESLPDLETSLLERLPPVKRAPCVRKRRASLRRSKKPARDREMARMYREGKTPREIAGFFRITRSYVYQILRKLDPQWGLDDNGSQKISEDPTSQVEIESRDVAVENAPKEIEKDQNQEKTAKVEIPWL